MATCPVCMTRFTTDIGMMRHVRAEHGAVKKVPAAAVPATTCPVCSARFTTDIGMMRHMGAEHGAVKKVLEGAAAAPAAPAAPYTCWKCGKGYTNRNSMQSHRAICGSVNPCAYPGCGETFKSPYYLKRHMRIHTGEHPFQCEVCGRRFHFSSNLNEHRRVHLPSNPVPCGQCTYRFENEANLRKHMDRVHSAAAVARKMSAAAAAAAPARAARAATPKRPAPAAASPAAKRRRRLPVPETAVRKRATPRRAPRHDHVCKVCSESFPDPINMEHHVRIHDPAKPFACGQCTYRFDRESEMVAHTAVHTERRSGCGRLTSPYQCGVCFQIFSDRGKRSRHMKSHDVSRPISCPHCTYRFPNKSRLTEHVSKFHPPHLAAAPVAVAAAAAAAPQLNLRCLWCWQQFSDEASLERHLEQHRREDEMSLNHASSHICFICGRSFPDATSMDRHIC